MSVKIVCLLAIGMPVRNPDVKTRIPLKDIINNNKPVNYWESTPVVNFLSYTENDYFLYLRLPTGVLIASTF